MRIKLADTVQIAIAALLGLVIKIGTDLSEEVSILNANNIKFTEKVINHDKRIERNELQIEKLKVEILTLERKQTQAIHSLEVQCKTWVKKLRLEIDPALLNR